MTVIQLGHENRLISFTFCSHFQRLFQIGYVLSVLPCTDSTLETDVCTRTFSSPSQACNLRLVQTIVTSSGRNLKCMVSIDPSLGKRREAPAPCRSIEWSPALCPERLTEASLEMPPTSSHTLPSCFGCLSARDY